nr:unnamed protein product [Callosobruchus analis]
MTPSLARRPPAAGRQELCANCKAAAVQAEVLQNDKEPSTSTEHEPTDKDKDKKSSRAGGEVTKDT